MDLRKKQNLIILIAIIVIVSGFSISNNINKQKVYVLSHEKNKADIEENNDITINDINVYEISTEKIVVHIEGEVVSPGVYELEEDTRIFDVIEAAGGLLKTADRRKINLAKKIVDEEYIYIPNENDENTAFQNINSVSTITNSNENRAPININKASAGELKALSGVGDVLANRIIEYRSEKGAFKSVEDLKNVSGIGDKKFSEIKDKVTIK